MSNTISMVARLGKDSERKPTQNGQILKFTVGENVGWGEKKTVNWWNCTLFGKQAEGNLMDYLVKGAQVFITGEVSFSEYEGKTYNNLTIKHIELVGGQKQQTTTAPQYGKGQAQNQPQQSGSYGNSVPKVREDLDSDILPF